MSFEKKPSIADNKVMIYPGVGFEDKDDNTSAKMLYADVPFSEGRMGEFNGRLDPYIKDNEIFRNNIDSEISLKEKTLDSNVTYCDEKQNSLTGKRTDESYKEYGARNNITAKGVFCKFVIWALEETFHSGIMHNESFINKLSKSLTG